MSFSCGVCGRSFNSERGVSVHHTAAHSGDKKYTDPDRLEELYHGEGLSMRQIADRLDCDHDRVAYWLDVHDIETRTGYAEQLEAPFTVDGDGYEVWRTYVSGEHLRVAVHRLAAVAEYGFSAVVGSDVHHKNGIRWDNRVENLEPLDPSEHRRQHGIENADEQRELMTELRDSGRLAGGGA